MMRRDRGWTRLTSFITVSALALAALAVRAGSVNYSYDKQGRLRSTTYSDASSTSYKLDAAGNRISIHLAGPDTTAPPPPASVSATASSYSQVNVSWSAVTDSGSGLGGYYIYRGGTKVATVAGNTYTDTNVKGSTGYSYSVAAYDVAGNTSSATAAPGVTTPAAPPPSVPSSLQGAAPAYNQIVLSWGMSTENAWGPGLAGYKIYRGVSASSLTLYQTITGTATAYTDTGVAANSTYYYSVASYDTLGAISAQSNVAPVTTPSGYIDTRTLTQGYYFQQIGGVQYYGFGSWGGSISPATLTGGTTATAFYDFTTPNNASAVISVSGFSADPGQTWLASATAHGVTKSAAAASYSYASGTATWSWTTVFNFTASGTTSVTISHR